MAEDKVGPAGSPTDRPEERLESQLISEERAIEDARALLRRSKNGVLSTISKRVEGWPFGSIAPYALDSRGGPVLFISAIAEHTKNILADDRVSLLVQDAEAGVDVQAHGRLTLLGRAERVASGEIADVRARYCARVPSAATYSEAHDFSFFRLNATKARFIGGFGRIFWLDATRLALEPGADPMAGVAMGILAHMNHDHTEALISYCRAFKGFDPKCARMVGLDQFGFDVECSEPDVRARFDFDRPVTPETVRAAVVEMAQKARGR